MREDLTDVTILLDRSGSMCSIENDTRGGFNSFIQNQKLIPGECRVTLIQFASPEEYLPVCVGALLSDVPPLTAENYRANGGSTAYLDALARAIKDTGHRLADMPEERRPGKVIFVSLTDGQENASQEYSPHADGWNRVKALREVQENVYKWTFVLIGQDYNPAVDGSRMGYPCANVISTAKAASSQMYEQFTKGVANYRMGCAGPQGAQGHRGATGSHVSNFASAMTDNRTIEEIAAQQPDPDVCADPAAVDPVDAK